MTGEALYNCVRDVNDTYRTALMNRKYYGYRLSRVRTWNITLETIIAIGTSAAIGAWVIWQSTPVGKNAWAVLAGVATILAIVKPFLNLSKQVERYSKLFVGHGDVWYDLKTITMELARVNDYTDKIREAFERALNRMKQLAPEDDPKVNEKLRLKCFNEVNTEIPEDSLWWPPQQ